LLTQKATKHLANTKNTKIMKKILIAALMAVFVGSSAFATDTKDVVKVSYKVKNNFEAHFTGAKNVSWAQRDNYTKATFVLADQPVEAFYSVDGELVATSRKVEFNKLPLEAIQTIQKKYSSYTVADTIELDQDGEKNYYVSVQDGEKKQILQVSLYGSVTVYNGKK
jgi:hypothetical protein